MLANFVSSQQFASSQQKQQQQMSMATSAADNITGGNSAATGDGPSGDNDGSARNANTPTGGGGSDDDHQKDGSSNVDNKRTPPFSMPGILHFLQHEWSRYELERAQWDVERSELKARISFLIGERKAQENLKHDLVRRIKMLEYALKQERAKHQETQQNTPGEQDENDVAGQQVDTPSHPKSNVPMDIDAILPPPLPPKMIANGTGLVPANQAWAQARETLCQYLQEIGYTERVLDFRSFRVKHLLGILPSFSPSDAEKDAKKLESAEKSLFDSEQAILEVAEAIKTSREKSRAPKVTKNREDDNEDSDSSSDEHAGAGDEDLDAEAVEALSDFSFLKKESRSPTEGGKPVKESLYEMKEHFKNEQERRMQKQKAAHKSESPQQPAANLSQSPQQRKQSPNKRNISVDTVPGIPPATVDSLMLDENERFADIKSGFEDDDDDEVQLRWNIRYTLRSHYDSVRAMQFHPVEPVLITASEDGTAKLWNLNHSSAGGKTDGNTKSSPLSTTGILDIEPVYTFRGHRGPILSLDMAPTGETCYTGGLDGTICCWNVPSTAGIDIYQTFDPSVLQERLIGHTDSVWCLCFHSASNRLISASSDGTIKTWIVGLADGAMPSPLLKSIKAEEGRPLSIDLVSTAEQQQLLVAYHGPKCNIRDLETGQVVVNFQIRENGGDGQPGTVNRVLSHPTMPVSITAGEDRKIRFFDNNTGKQISATMAHVEGVATMAIDTNGLYLLSGSHDGSLRLWNAEKRVCLQEIAAHRKKFGSGVMTVAFHPSRQLIGSAGADSLAKVFGPVRMSPRSSLIATASPPSSSGSSGPSSVVGSPQKSSPMNVAKQQIATSQL